MPNEEEKKRGAVVNHVSLQWLLQAGDVGNERNGKEGTRPPHFPTLPLAFNVLHEEKKRSFMSTPTQLHTRTQPCKVKRRKKTHFASMPPDRVKRGKNGKQKQKKNTNTMQKRRGTQTHTKQKRYTRKRPKEKQKSMWRGQGSAACITEQYAHVPPQAPALTPLRTRVHASEHSPSLFSPPTQLPHPTRRRGTTRPSPGRTTSRSSGRRTGS